jgi:uncharacterized protein YndB with AHSA1/START domain
MKKQSLNREGEKHMPHIEREILIDRPVEEVFDFVADGRQEPRYNPRILHVEQLSPGPIGHGTQFRSEGKLMGPIRVEIISQITTYERPQRLRASATTGIGALPVMQVQGTQTFDPVPGGSRVRWSLEVEPRGVFTLLTPQLARGLGQRLDTTFANLKRLLEAQQESLPQA